MIPPQLDFRQLKQAVPIEQVLRARGLHCRLTKKGRKLFGPCPLHGGDNPHAFVVDLDRNLWYCFTRCATGGDVVKLLLCLGDSYRQAALFLASLSIGSPPLPSRPPRPPEHPTTFQPYTRSLSLDPSAPFLKRKGIQPATARRFEIGASQGPGFLAHCIGVHLHDPEGRPLGYAGRRLDPHEAQRLGKWKLPPRFPKQSILYNLHRVAPAPAALVVVECPWGVLRLAQIGIPAVALLGTSLSLSQRRLLVTAAPHLVLMLDGDPAGRRATCEIYQLLSPHAVSIVHLPPNLDPDDLSDSQLTACLAPFLP